MNLINVTENARVRYVAYDTRPCETGLKEGIDYSRLPRAPCSTAANQTFAARAIFRYQLLLERGSHARQVIQLFARAIPLSCCPISTMDVSRARAAAAFIVIHQIIKKKPKRKPRWWIPNCSRAIN